MAIMAFPCRASARWSSRLALRWGALLQRLIRLTARGGWLDAPLQHNLFCDRPFLFSILGARTIDYASRGRSQIRGSREGLQREGRQGFDRQRRDSPSRASNRPGDDEGREVEKRYRLPES